MEPIANRPGRLPTPVAAGDICWRAKASVRGRWRSGVPAAALSDGNVGVPVGRLLASVAVVAGDVSPAGVRISGRGAPPLATVPPAAFVFMAMVPGEGT